MKYILVLSIAGILFLNAAIVAYANTSSFLPLVQNGTQTQPEGANRTIQVDDAVSLVCGDSRSRLVITAQTGTNIDVVCLPEAASTPIAEAPTDTPEPPVDMPIDEAPTDTPEPPVDMPIDEAPTNTPEPPPTATPVEAPEDNNPQPLGQAGNWDLIFNEEFNGTSLDLSTWEPSWFAGNNISEPVNTIEDGCYSPSQISVRDGMLNLRADTTTDANCRTKDNSRTPYVSGLINTRESFTFSYGYMEARIYLPGSNGDIWNWPAWWSDGTGTWPRTGEIDVMEGLESHRPCWHYHYEDNGGTHRGPGGCADIDGTGWHTYAALWEEGKITYFYDGVQVGEITEGVIDAAHFLILNYGIQEEHGINVPATMQVDYVRVWKP